MTDVQKEPVGDQYDGSSPMTQSLHPERINELNGNEENSKQKDVKSNNPKYADLQNLNFEGSGAKYDVNFMDPEEYQKTQAQLNDFLQMSLHMSGEHSRNSSNYIQDDDFKKEDESDESDDTDSSTNEDDVQCDICQKIFLNNDDLNLHIRSRRMNDKRYECCNCHKTFRDNTQLKVHARKHTGEKPFECNICAKKFTVNGNLNKHMRIHTGEKRFECTDCGRKFTQFAHLEDHLKTHSGERPFVCSFCQSAFKTKARLRKHEKSHTDNKPSKRAVNCPKCNIVLKSNRQLSTHLLTHIQETDGPFICPLCGKAFAIFADLQEHQINHADVKTFICQCCDRAFTNAGHLRRHMNSHSGFRPFACDICQKGFPNGQNLSRHKRTHDGFRPYSCSVCKRPFPSSQNLKRHMMTHTGEKPFTCTDCDRGFLTLENLNRHRRTHTGEKPFACELCGKLFAHSTTAKEHYRMVHTGERPFRCPICPKSFAISKMLYKHVRERHPDHFPQFKKEKSVTPNMKKAQEKIRMTVKHEDDIKTEHGGDKDNEASMLGSVKLKEELFVNVKEEPMDEDSICDNSTNYKEESKFKIEPPIVSVDNSCKTDIIIVKSEREEGPVISELVEIAKIVEVPKSDDTDICFKNETIDIPFVKIEKPDLSDV